MDLNIEITGLIQSKDNERLQQLIVENPELANEKTPQGISLLTLAAYCRNQPAINLILSKKNTIDLFESAAVGDVTMVKQYLVEDPNLINSYSIDGFTPLGLSCFFGHKKLADFLIKEGADVNQPSNNDFAVKPIHSASANSSVSLTKLLLENGADVNAKQMSGVTALHSAAHNGQLDLVKLLVDNGADARAKDESKKSPEQMAREKGFTEVVSYFRNLKKQPNG